MLLMPDPNAITFNLGYDWLHEYFEERRGFSGCMAAKVVTWRAAKVLTIVRKFLRSLLLCVVEEVATCSHVNLWPLSACYDIW